MTKRNVGYRWRLREIMAANGAPVVARALGHGYGTATEHAIAARGTWSR